MKAFIRNPMYVILACTLAASMGCESGGDDAAAPEGTTPTQEAPTVDPDAALDTEKFNLNTASEEQFLTIPNVGDRMVHEFEEYRPYVSIQQFRREIGKYVDEEQVAAYEEYVFVPVSPNESDEATLMQLPGVDAAAAADLAASRPFDSVDAFLERLGELVTAEELEQAEQYLASP